MSETKFTKGEWIASAESFVGEKTGIIYIEGGGFDISGAPDAIANTHLIAAAPEMYEFIKSLLVYDMLNDADTTEALELLAKARGEL
jgi:hypothetical protein